ncbi:MAG: metal ABC transporter substrate-binding protein [Actinomycetota bacterium]
MYAQRRRIAYGVLLLAFLAGACSSSKAGDAAKLRVVTAFYPIELAARRIGGSFVAVTNLTPPGGEPHDVELRPSDIRSLQSADVVLYFADGFQPAVEDALKSLPGKSVAVDLLEGLPLKTSGAGSEEGLTVDPHVWLSPALMQKIADKITAVLAENVSAHADEVRSASAAFAKDLSAIDDAYRMKLAQCARGEIFTAHAAFDYLAQQYGLEQIAISGLTPEAEPSSKRLQQIADRARRAHATTIFFETLVSPRVAEAVARIVGARTAVLDPIEGLTREEHAAGADYVSIMRSNLNNLVEALDCKS